VVEKLAYAGHNARMETILSAHGCYRHQYHIVWIPKYRHDVLIRGVKTYVERGLKEISLYHPDVHVLQYNIQSDHLHIIADIPPKYSVSEIVGKIKANTSRKIRKRFEWIREIYKENVFWSPGFFSSTVGIDEEQIRKYVEFQEKVDKGTYQMKLGF
jgi:putative transposase